MLPSQEPNTHGFSNPAVIVDKYCMHSDLTVLNRRVCCQCPSALIARTARGVAGPPGCQRVLTYCQQGTDDYQIHLGLSQRGRPLDCNMNQLVRAADGAGRSHLHDRIVITTQYHQVPKFWTH